MSHARDHEFDYDITSTQQDLVKSKLKVVNVLQMQQINAFTLEGSSNKYTEWGDPVNQVEIMTNGNVV